MQFDETGNRKRKYRYGDEDEIELEQQERKRRQALNKEFKHFAEKIAEAATASVSSQCAMCTFNSPADPISRLATPSKPIFPSENLLSKACPSEQMSNSNRQQNALFTFPIRLSSSSRSAKSRLRP